MPDRGAHSCCLSFPGCLRLEAEEPPPLKQTRVRPASARSGLEVADAKGSPAISDGFTASVVSPPGTYMKDNHNGKPGFTPWIGFMARLTNDGYKFQDQDGKMSMFEVYSGQGGAESVTMYAAVVDPTK